MPRVELTVLEVRPETPRAATIRLDAGTSGFAYRPGQYVILDAAQFPGVAAGKGYYSISSDALDPRIVELTVKEPEGAKPDTIAVHLVRGIKKGDPVTLEGPKGNYHLPSPPADGITGVLHVCAGSGVAPNRGMIRESLGRDWPLRHLLLLQDRTEEDLLFRDEWKDLQERHPDRFRMKVALSRQSGERLTEETLRAGSRDFLDLGTTVAMLCGPNRPREDGPGFRDHWAALLGKQGIPPDRIIWERG